MEMYESENLVFKSEFKKYNDKIDPYGGFPTIVNMCIPTTIHQIQLPERT